MTTRPEGDYWEAWAATMTHPEADNGIPDSEPEVITCARSSGAAARLANLLRDATLSRLTTADLLSRCGLHKANLARTLRTAVVISAMDRECWTKEKAGRGVALVRVTTSAGKWDF